MALEACDLFPRAGRSLLEPGLGGSPGAIPLVDPGADPWRVAERLGGVRWRGGPRRVGRLPPRQLFGLPDGTPWPAALGAVAAGELEVEAVEGGPVAAVAHDRSLPAAKVPGSHRAMVDLALGEKDVRIGKVEAQPAPSQAHPGG